MPVNTRFRQVAIVAAAALLALHMLMAHFQSVNTGRRQEPREGVPRVFSPGVYRLFAIGMDDFASRMILLHTLYDPQNGTIPSIDFAALTAALNSASELDRNNIQPYLHTVRFWGLAKSPKSRKYMAEYLLTGLERFPENWEIPYAIYSMTKDRDSAGAEFYLRIAADRAAAHGGPEWLAEMCE